ncbi:MAG: hypothetical protein V7767_07790 [Leeuwenhoekiella sp.]
MSFTKIVIVIAYLICSQRDYAQVRPSTNEVIRNRPIDMPYVNDEKANLKEAALQINYFLKQQNNSNYIFIVDGKTLKAEEFTLYKESIIKQMKQAYFIKEIDSILGYPSKRKRMLIIISTLQ